MKTRLRLAEWPFLGAILVMALALALPWALTDPAGEPTLEVSEILPWAVPEPGDLPQLDPDSVQLAGQAGTTFRDVAQP